MVNNTEKKYHTSLLTDKSKNKDYAEVAMDESMFLYTGKQKLFTLK